jgi:hypothetical protein
MVNSTKAHFLTALYSLLYMMALAPPEPFRQTGFFITDEVSPELTISAVDQTSSRSLSETCFQQHPGLRMLFESDSDTMAHPWSSCIIMEDLNSLRTMIPHFLSQKAGRVSELESTHRALMHFLDLDDHAKPSNPKLGKLDLEEIKKFPTALHVKKKLDEFLGETARLSKRAEDARGRVDAYLNRSRGSGVIEIGADEAAQLRALIQDLHQWEVNLVYKKNEISSDMEDLEGVLRKLRG